MNDLNQVCLIGNLTKDCEVKYFNDGSCAVRFSIANNRAKKENNQFVDYVSYFDIKMYGKSAENLIQYLKKGKKIGISGTLTQDRWTDTNGNNRSAVYILANSVNLLGGVDKPQGNYQRNQSNGYEHQAEQGEGFQEDIPF